MENRVVRTSVTELEPISDSMYELRNKADQMWVVHPIITKVKRVMRSLMVVLMNS